MNVLTNNTAVVLIVYNRPEHTLQVLKALEKNKVENLFIFSDAPKENKDIGNVAKVRNLIAQIEWTKPEVVYRTENWGLRKSIVSAVNYVFTRFDRVILLEDDCVPEDTFFDFMQKCLDKYEYNDRVFGISGYCVNPPTDLSYEYDAFFFPRIGSWGWGTWKKSWAYHNENLPELVEKVLSDKCDVEIGGTDIANYIIGILEGKMKDIWTINWVLSVYLQKGFYVYPVQSHLKNIGLDGSGVHCGTAPQFETIAADRLIQKLPDDVLINYDLIKNYAEKIARLPNNYHQRLNNYLTSEFIAKKPVKMLNLGCGNRFHLDWTNIDYKSSSPLVTAHNLSQGIPSEDNSFDAVYHSHLLEHFSKSSAIDFMKECCRVLKNGGIIRVAVPDLEKIAEEYLINLKNAINGSKEASERYDWMMLEMYDQTVRNVSGGEMMKYWLKNPLPQKEFIYKRMGAEVRNVINDLAVNQNYYSNLPLENSLSNEQIGKFRRSGEIHQWMYDRYSLSRLLENAGFKNIRICRANESAIRNFNSYLLDIELDGSVRKPDSLFMEAEK